MKPVLSGAGRGALALALAALGACDNMQRQSNLRPLDGSAQFADGASARIPPAHTVPAGPRASVVLLTGQQGGQWVLDLPLPLTRALLDRGRERFNIECAVCHGEDGAGQGIVVRRGFPAPPSLETAALRAAPAGALFDVITRGYGAMYPAADRVAPPDRWAIVAYIRALQFSQQAPLAALTPGDRARLPLP
jgi:mono/diheme cytochrome c family protein